MGQGATQRPRGGARVPRTCRAAAPKPAFPTPMCHERPSRPGRGTSGGCEPAAPALICRISPPTSCRSQRYPAKAVVWNAGSAPNPDGSPDRPSELIVGDPANAPLGHGKQAFDPSKAVAASPVLLTQSRR